MKRGNGEFDVAGSKSSGALRVSDDDVILAEDLSRRLRDVEREVDRIPGEIRTQTATVTGKLDVLTAKLETGFASVATREWVMSTALWVYSLVVAILFVLAGMILTDRRSADGPTTPTAPIESGVSQE